MTGAQMKARLRAYDLPVKGTVADLADRLERLDDLRRVYGQGGLDELSRDDLKRLLDRMDVKAWKLSTRAAMLAVAERLATRREPVPAAPVAPLRYAVVWRNPATHQRETVIPGLLYAEATREADALRRDTERRIDEVALYLREDRDERVSVTVAKEPIPYPLGRHRSPEDEAATAAWYDLSKINRASAGPALSGDRAGLHALQEKADRLAQRVRAARAPRENPRPPRAKQRRVTGWIA